LDGIFPKELNILLFHHDNQEFTLGINIPHWYGDGKGPRIWKLQTNEKVFTNPFLNGYLDGFTLILEVRLAIPVSKKNYIWR
jgi:predicted permease